MSMAGYTKLFNSILASTIWEADMPTRIVWITLLAMADKHGVAEGSVPGLATFARVSLKDCRKALTALQAPDPDSRSREHDGRRIEAVEGGWRLINHAKYRAKLGDDERREYLRVKQAEYRKKKGQSTNVNTVSDKSTRLTHAEAEAKADTEAKKEKERARETKKLNEEPTTVQMRAGSFCETTYPELYQKHRKGARYVGRPVLDFQEAVLLCGTWDDERLAKIATVFLTTDHPFAESGSRTMAQFRSMASWADGLLREKGL